jgi:hypothetical protein
MNNSKLPKSNIKFSDLHCNCNRPSNCTESYSLNKTMYERCKTCHKFICGCDICGGSPSRYGDCGY